MFLSVYDVFLLLIVATFLYFPFFSVALLISYPDILLILLQLIVIFLFENFIFVRLAFCNADFSFAPEYVPYTLFEDIVVYALTL